jgi:hypothetical protein
VSSASRRIGEAAPRVEALRAVKASGLALALGAVLAGASYAQEGFFRGRGRSAPTMEWPSAEYDGRFAFARLRYGSGFGRNPGWAHDYPTAEMNFQRILSELTLVPTHVEASNIFSLDDPDLTLFPIAYMSEPGFWTMSEAEKLGLRAYLQKGGFIIFDDFRGARDWTNLETRMREVLPDLRWVPLDATHPIFHSFFEINTLPEFGYYGEAQFLGLFEQNDPERRLLAVANYNHDLGELWEFSGTGWVPVDVSNDAYKFGVNYVMYAMTH